MNELQIFKNEVFEVAAKVEGDKILFDAEQVAKCLGIVSKTTKNGIIYENVRWSRVNEFLPQVAEIQKGDLIPEPLVYKLAFKASNEIAEKFQDWLAIEVIPAVRKHGAYMTDDVLEKAVTDPDFMIGLLTNLKEEKQKRLDAEKTIEEQKPKVVFAEAIEVSKNSILVKDLAALLKQKGIDIGQNRLFNWLRENGYLCKKLGAMFNKPTQKSLDLGLFELKPYVRSGSNGEMKTEFTPKVTGKGQIYFINKFLAMQNLAEAK
jgi:anti-repressor protein